MKRLLAFLGCLIAPCAAWAGERVDYVKEIKPILARHCYACHGLLRQRGGLKLNTAALIRKGGDNGPAIVAGKSDESLLMARVTGEVEPRMPREAEPLSEKEIALLKTWIDQGAVAPEEPVPDDPRQHWAFQRPQRPPVPHVQNAAWVRNPIDAFIAAEHEKRGLKPLLPAEKHVLLRRVYLDLIGLPPTREELQAFLADDSPDAYEKVVDRLLASPRYGERWGRHWMDVWRYSDWAGFGMEVRVSQRHVWRWRDWIVESLNADKGYGRMIVEMLAGDEAAPADPDTLRATGYLVRSWYKFNRNVWLQDTVEHVGKAFLGVTINCARCHDHMYDPISQEEYYRFRAFFEPHNVRTDRVPGQPDLIQDGLPRAFDAEPNASTYLFVRGDEANPVKESSLVPGLPAILEPNEIRVEPVALPAPAYYPGLRPFVQAEELARAKADADRAQQAVAKATEVLAKAKARLAELPGAPGQAVQAAGAGVPPAAAPPASDLEKAQAAAAAAEQQLAVEAEKAASLAEKQRAVARANLAFLEARIEADKAKYATPLDSKAATVLERIAAKAEREAAVCKAEEEFLKAQQELAKAQQAAASGDAKGKEALAPVEKKVAEAGEKLKATQAALEQPAPSYSPIGEVYPSTSTGRRLALARWIANTQNPLTARVAVNHMWMRHFGAPLVPTVFDFGLNGKPPINPAVLDWLAVEFMHPSVESGTAGSPPLPPLPRGGTAGTEARAGSKGGWSMKALHRLIVTSNAYRMQSSSGSAEDSNLAIDPENHYLWRMNPRRMEAEVVRDSVLHVAGQLDASMGGPEIDHEAGLTSRRRSLYFRHALEKQMTFLKVFDAAGVNECYRRSESVIPQQALALANSKLALAQARLLAASLSKAVQPQADAAFVIAAFEQVLSRRPSDQERQECLAFLESQAKLFGNPERLTAAGRGAAPDVQPDGQPHLRARENLVHVLLNHHDFVTIR